MAAKGAYIFDGYIKNRGMVKVFTDLDNSKFVFAQSTKSDSMWYVSRDRVEPRKKKGSSKVAKKSETKKSALDELQLKLF